MLRHIGHFGCKSFHDLAIFRTELFEIGLNLFHKDTLFIADKFYAFDIHFIEHQLSH